MKSPKQFFQNLFKSKWEIEFEKESEKQAEEAAELIAPVMDKLTRGEHVEFLKCVRCGADAVAKELLDEFKGQCFIKDLGPLCKDCMDILKLGS
jgi:hypothetical protein